MMPIRLVLPLERCLGERPIQAPNLASVSTPAPNAAVRLDQLRGDHPGLQGQRLQLARPVMRTRARLHCNDAAGRQPNAPLDELVARQRLAGEYAPDCVDRVNLDHALGPGPLLDIFVITSCKKFGCRVFVVGRCSPQRLYAPLGLTLR